MIYFSGKSEYIYWDEEPGEFRIVDDISISGGMTVGGTIRVGETETAVAYNAIDDDTTVMGSWFMDDKNDLYVAGDVEVGRDISVANSLTIGGILFPNGVMVVGFNLTVDGDSWSYFRRRRNGC